MSQYSSTPTGKLKPKIAKENGRTYSITFWTWACCLSTGPPALRAIICFWVRNVVAPIVMIMSAATIFTVVALPSSSRSSATGLLKAAEIGAPKTFACAPWEIRSLLRPYFPTNRLSTPLGLNSFITRNSEKKIGSCRTSGKHPEIGFAPWSL